MYSDIVLVCSFVIEARVPIFSRGWPRAATPRNFYPQPPAALFQRKQRHFDSNPANIDMSNIAALAQMITMQQRGSLVLQKEITASHLYRFGGAVGKADRLMIDATHL